MKIVIKESQGKNFTLPLPSCVIFSPATALFLPKILKQNGMSVSRRQCAHLLKTLRRCRRRFPHWNIVEVHSADGDHVVIRL